MNEGVPKTRWQRFIDAKEASSRLAQRQSLFFGTDAKSGARLDVPRGGHMHITGKTESGKTSASLASIVLQAIRGYRDDSGNWSPKSPIIVFDFKGDEAFFNTVRLAAEADGRQFRFLSTRRGDGYHFFDPFQTFKLRHLEPIQLATEFVRAFSLDYGLTYGGLYFTDQNLVLLLEAIKELLRADDVLTLARLSSVVERLARKSSYADARHILLCLQKLAEYPQVDLAVHRREPAAKMNMREALKSGEVLYLFFEMDNEGPALRQIAGLALDALVQAAKSIRKAGEEVPFTYVIADEFYHIASKSFGELLSTAREWGLYFVLANQNIGQLKTHDSALPEIIDINTSVKQTYSINDPDETERWQRLSGERIDFGRSTRLGIDMTSFSERRDWYLSDQDRMDANDTKLRSLLYFDDGLPKRPGSRVRVVQGHYPIFEWEYLRNKRTPIPEVPAHDVCQPADESPRSEPVQATRRQKQKVERPDIRWKEMDVALEARMKQVWEAITTEAL